MLKILAIIKHNDSVRPIIIEIDSDAEKFEDLYIEDVNRLRTLIKQKFYNSIVLNFYVVDGIQTFQIKEVLEEI